MTSTRAMIVRTIKIDQKWVSKCGVCDVGTVKNATNGRTHTSREFEDEPCKGWNGEECYYRVLVNKRLKVTDD